MVGLEAISFKKAQNVKGVSFGGHDLRANDNGEKVYKFYLPKMAYNNASLKYRKFKLDDNGNLLSDIATKEESLDYEKGNTVIELNTKALKLSPNEILGYRFEIDGKDYNDKYRYTEYGGKKYNIAIPLSSDVLQTPASIYHILPSIFNPKSAQQPENSPKTFTNALGEIVTVDNKTAVMNHVTKFDTTLKDVIAKIPHIKEMGFKRLLSTPIFGQDTLSSHGYWTANPFQITETLGRIEDFEDLQINLFKNSMGFIADGAFTSEGLSGIHLRDILRNGSASPFVNWFELHNFPLKRIGLGVLPDSELGYENMDIRVVNSPVIWSVNVDGKPVNDFGKQNPSYNPQKETYIQIYDKRLTSKEQLANDNVFHVYDIKNPQEKSDITGWTDSVLPYAFPVDANEVVKRANLVKKMKIASKDASQPAVEAKEFLRRWENFELVPAETSGGLTLWTGNKDLAKLRFTVPVSVQNKMKNDAISVNKGGTAVADAVLASNQVQDYIKKVGEYWTNKTAKTLRMYTAQQLAGAKDAQEFLSIIRQKAGKELPVAIKYLPETSIEKAINGQYYFSANETAPVFVEDLFEEYPPEALEVSSYFSSLLSYPGLKEKMQDKLYSGVMKEVTEKILSAIDAKRKNQEPLLNADFELNPETSSITQLIADDITRFLLIKGLSANFNIDSFVSADKEDLYNDLQKILPDKTLLSMKTAEEKENYLISQMRKNIASISTADIEKVAEYLSNKINNINPAQINVANLILDKTEAGLNWRIDAAKDIAEIENFLESEVTVVESWQNVLNFWNEFNQGVKKYNNHSYQIAEFTDTNLSYSSKNNKFQNAGAVEQSLIDKGGFTTQSNYSYLYSLLQSLYSGFPERNEGDNFDAHDKLVPKMLFGWEGTPGYLYSGNKNNLCFSHVAVGNHDKQRISHTFAMNMPLAYKENYSSWGNDVKGQVYDDLMSSSLQHASFFEDLQSSKSLDGKFYDDNFINRFGQVINKISQKNLAKMAALTDSFNTAIQSIDTDSFPKNADGIRLSQDKALKLFTEAVERLALNENPHSKLFFYRNFETNYADIINIAQQSNQEFAEFLQKIQPLVHKELTRFSAIRGAQLARLMVALPGAPTLYAGDELLELGGEDKARNVYLQNRNILDWSKVSNPSYSHVDSYKEELAKVFNLRNDKDLTSLVNGDTLLLKYQGHAGDNRHVVGIYRYNENDDAIILLHNKGFNSSRRLPDSEARKATIPFVDMGLGELNNGNDLGKEFEKQVGLPAKLSEGALYVNALDSSQKFIVAQSGNIHLLDNDGNPSDELIELKDSVTILKRLK